MLVGCGGGSGAPLSPSFAGVAAERTRERAAFTLLYSFKGLPYDGEVPLAGLTNDKGTLYGTTEIGGQGLCTLGGPSGCGTVFTITPSGKESVLYGFTGKSGEFPFAGLINVKGTLYGTTYEGGVHCTEKRGVCGTIFSIASSGKETVLHDFRGGSGDGWEPFAGLLNVNGTLYGTTEFGGANDGGTVFSITTAGKETVLYSFGTGSGDGTFPYAGLINVNGTLYGTTEYGGAGTCGCGTAFSITTSGKETVLHSFGTRSGDGEYPLADLINVNGRLYGTTSSGGANCSGSFGCGTVFSITTSGTEVVIYSFKGGPGDGNGPDAGLVEVNGRLYGTTGNGGAGGAGCSPIGCGTVFAITTSGTETVLHSFGPRKYGAYPLASLIDVKGTLYGTTDGGGRTDHGTVFSITP